MNSKINISIIVITIILVILFGALNTILLNIILGAVLFFIVYKSFTHVIDKAFNPKISTVNIICNYRLKQQAKLIAGSTALLSLLDPVISTITTGCVVYLSLRKQQPIVKKPMNSDIVTNTIWIHRSGSVRFLRPLQKVSEQDSNFDKSRTFYLGDILSVNCYQKIPSIVTDIYERTKKQKKYYLIARSSCVHKISNALAKIASSKKIPHNNCPVKCWPDWGFTVIRKFYQIDKNIILSLPIILHDNYTQAGIIFGINRQDRSLVNAFVVRSEYAVPIAKDELYREYLDFPAPDTITVNSNTVYYRPFGKNIRAVVPDKIEQYYVRGIEYIITPCLPNDHIFRYYRISDLMNNVVNSNSEYKNYVKNKSIDEMVYFLAKQIYSKDNIVLDTVSNVLIDLIKKEYFLWNFLVPNKILRIRNASMEQYALFVFDEHGQIINVFKIKKTNQYFCRYRSYSQNDICTLKQYLPDQQ